MAGPIRTHKEKMQEVVTAYKKWWKNPCGEYHTSGSDNNPNFCSPCGLASSCAFIDSLCSVYGISRRGLLVQIKAVDVLCGA